MTQPQGEKKTSRFLGLADHLQLQIYLNTTQDSPLTSMRLHATLQEYTHPSSLPTGAETGLANIPPAGSQSYLCSPVAQGWLGDRRGHCPGLFLQCLESEDFNVFGFQALNHQPGQGTHSGGSWETPPLSPPPFLMTLLQPVSPEATAPSLPSTLDPLPPRLQNPTVRFAPENNKATHGAS